MYYWENILTFKPIPVIVVLFIGTVAVFHMSVGTVKSFMKVYAQTRAARVSLAFEIISRTFTFTSRNGDEKERGELDLSRRDPR